MVAITRRQCGVACCFKDELVPVLERFGELYELRLMMNFNGVNRGYCFATYTTRADAKRAAQGLNDFEIRNRRFLGACLSVDNCRLFVGGIPRNKHREVQLYCLLHYEVLITAKHFLLSTHSVLRCHSPLATNMVLLNHLFKHKSHCIWNQVPGSFYPPLPNNSPLYLLNLTGSFLTFILAIFTFHHSFVPQTLLIRDSWYLPDCLQWHFSTNFSWLRANIIASCGVLCHVSVYLHRQ